MYQAGNLLDVVGIALYYNSAYTAERAVYINTKETLPTWFTSHNTKVYYVLATLTEETITQEEVIEQLNAIYNALSYNKETNVIIESSNAQMIASVSVVEGE